MNTDIAIVSLIITNVSLAVGTGAKMLYDAWQKNFEAKTKAEEARTKRQYELEDREQTRLDRLAEHALLIRKIDTNIELTKEGTEAAKSAYHESNNVNLKIEQLNIENIKTNETAAKTQEQTGSRMEEISGVGVDTNKRVQSIENKIK